MTFPFAVPYGGFTHDSSVFGKQPFDFPHLYHHLGNIGATRISIISIFE